MSAASPSLFSKKTARGAAKVPPDAVPSAARGAAATLEPLPYHLRLREFLRTRHAAAWDYYASAEAQASYRGQVELELLKSTYRMARKDHPYQYEVIDVAQAALGIQAPITLYQAQNSRENSAMLYFTPDHAHIVAMGKILALLNQDEFAALIGHELSHFKLWSQDGGDFLVAERLLTGLTSRPDADKATHESARLFRLYTEIYADRGGLLAAKSAEAMVATLVKTVTNLEIVNPLTYIAQAEEILDRATVRSEGYTHPEIYIRTLAVKIWADGKEAIQDGDPDTLIEGLIEGGWVFENMDLLRQERLVDLTRDVLRYLLKPDWVRTDRVLEHAGLFFRGFDPDEAPATPTLEALAAQFAAADAGTRHYLTYVLLDFATVDPAFGEYGYALAFHFAEKLGIAEDLANATKKEFKMLKRESTRLRQEAPRLLAEAADAMALTAVPAGNPEEGVGDG